MEQQTRARLERLKMDIVSRHEQVEAYRRMAKDQEMDLAYDEECCMVTDGAFLKRRDGSWWRIDAEDLQLWLSDHTEEAT